MTDCDASGVPDQDLRHVYIVDDDVVMRRSTSFMLTSAGYLPRAFVAGSDFLEEAPSLAAGVVLLDIRMPQVDGFSVLDRIPDVVRPLLPVIVMTGHGDLPSAVRAMKSGARDFLEKPFAEAALLELLREAIENLRGLLPQHENRRAKAALIDRLTPRQRDVLLSLALGNPNKVVAKQLGLSVRTVEKHRLSLLEKLGVRSWAEAIRIAHDAGVLA